MDDADLLARARHEPAAFGAFYRRHVGAVLAFHRRRTGDPEVALDLTAETFARALEGVASFEPGRGPARAWLFAIARNLLADSYRRGRVADEARRRLGIPPLAVDDEDLERVEAAADAADLLAILPDDQRTAIDARVLGEEPYADIAARIECSEGVVRQRVSRGLATLRARMTGGER